MSMSECPMTDLADPELARNPHPVYHQLRGHAGVTRAELGRAGGDLVVLSRYSDVSEALHSPGAFSSRAGMLGQDRPVIPVEIDAPAHARYRRLLDPLFSARALAPRETEMRQFAANLLGPLADRGACDLHAEFTVPFPCVTFLRLVGFPVSDLDLLLRWKYSMIQPQHAAGTDDPEVLAALLRDTGAEIRSYFDELAEERTRRPENDLMTHLLQAEADGDRLTREEVLDICILQLTAGLDTVTASIDCSVAYLAAHPDAREALVADPSLVPKAVEEFLRRETPVSSVFRRTTTDVVIAGDTVPSGSLIAIMLGAANTDGDEFPNGDDVIFERGKTRHLAFGGGTHRCLGSHLARMELRIAIEELHRHIPRYALAEGAELVYLPVIRSLAALPVVW